MRAAAVLALAAALLAFAPAMQALESERTLERDGETLRFRLITHAPGAHLLEPGQVYAPVSALDTSKRLHQSLVAGDVESAALLSNAPRRRFEVLRDYRSALGEEAFRKVFEQYFDPANRLLAEVAIGRHRLLVWRLETRERIVGQYYVEIEGRVLMDDVPSVTRGQLRRVLEAWRAGELEQ